MKAKEQIQQKINKLRNQFDQMVLNDTRIDLLFAVQNQIQSLNWVLEENHE